MMPIKHWPRPPIRVLVVEDRSVHQKLAERLLQQYGCDVEIRANGREAVELTDQQHFDLILMDVDMPVMDGLTATAFIREREARRGQRTAIVAVTSEDDPQRCLAAGMDDYVSKPLRRESLHAAMSHISPDSSGVA